MHLLISILKEVSFLLRFVRRMDSGDSQGISGILACLPVGILDSLGIIFFKFLG